MMGNNRDFVATERLVSDISAHVRRDMYNLFRVSEGKGYSHKKAPLDAEVIRAHVRNERPVAVFVLEGDTIRTAALDVDVHSGSLDFEEVATSVTPIMRALEADGLKPLPFISGGGAGLHIWLFWEEPQVASAVRRYLTGVLRSVGFEVGTSGLIEGEIEIYPKQDSLAEGRVGNPIALPLARNSAPLDQDLNPIPWSEYKPPLISELYSADTGQLRIHEDKAAATKRTLHVPHSLRNDDSVLPGDQEEAASALIHVPSDDHDTWIKIALALKHSFGREGFGIWDKWSSKSHKYPGTDAVRETWDGLEPTGAITLGTVFHLAQQGGWNGPTDPIIREMNTQFGILTHGASTRIILKAPKQSGQGPISWLSKTSFEDRLAGDRISVESYDGSLRKVSKAKHWLNHPRAAHYYEIIFDPGLPPGHNGNRWNMWRGFAVEPKLGKWDLLQDHIFTNICSGNTEHYEWLLNWMALGVQNPGEVVGTAPVLAGLPGTGKGVLANAYGRLWGEHYVSVTKDDHISGRFNNHLMGKRFVYIDEGMFGGDRRNAGVVKTMITEPRLMFEAKGLDPFFIENHMIFMVTSNERSIVAADIGDRRWQVLSVSDKHREDRPYFAAIVAQLASGGTEAMLHDLLTRDASTGPDPHKTIRTPELFDQIIQAQGPIEKYLYQVLDEGFLPQPDAPGNGAGVTTIGAMLDQMKRTQPRADYVQLPLFGRTLTNLFPGVKKTSSGKVIVGRDANGQLRTERSMRYDFPPLTECRRLFAQFVGQDVPWSNDLEEWLGMDDASLGKRDDYPF